MAFGSEGVRAGRGSSALPFFLVYLSQDTEVRGVICLAQAASPALGSAELPLTIPHGAVTSRAELQFSSFS